MSDFKNRFDKWQQETRDRFEEIDKQLGISDKVVEGVKTVSETAAKGAGKIKNEAEKSEFGKSAVKAAEETIRTAESAAKKAWDASEPLRDAAEDVGETAQDVIGKAGKTAGNAADAAVDKAGSIFNDARDSVTDGAKRVSSMFNFGAAWGKTFDSTLRSLSSGAEWIQENPLKAAATGVSMVVGAGLGVVFTGVSSHWLLNSAIPTWTIKKASEQFTGYLRSQEELIAKGDLSDAEAEKVKFEKDIVKTVGAPLLGAFSFASGAVMMTKILNPKTITGFPLGWLLGGNPLLEGVWFFGNGLVCFKTGYDFFMIALEDSDEVQNMMKQVKGLLPA